MNFEGEYMPIVSEKYIPANSWCMLCHYFRSSLILSFIIRVIILWFPFTCACTRKFNIKSSIWASVFYLSCYNNDADWIYTVSRSSRNETFLKHAIIVYKICGLIRINVRWLTRGENMLCEDNDLHVHCKTDDKPSGVSISSWFALGWLEGGGPVGAAPGEWILHWVLHAYVGVKAAAVMLFV